MNWRDTSSALVLILALLAVGCCTSATAPVPAPVPQLSEERSVKTDGVKIEHKNLSLGRMLTQKDLSDALETARKGSDTWYDIDNSRLIAAGFVGMLRPEVEKATGKVIGNFPIDNNPLAKPLYDNLLQIILHNN